MQYAIMELNQGIKRIMDVAELELLDKHIKGEQCTVSETTGYKVDLVYGSYYPQPNQDATELKEKMLIAKGYALAYIENGTCRMFELLDIKISDLQLIEAGNQVPFVALVKGLESEPTSIHSISAFLRFDDMIVEDNIINRFGIYAIHTIRKHPQLKYAAIIESVESEWLQDEKWTELIEWDLLKPIEHYHHHHTDHFAVIEELKYTDDVRLEEMSTFVITHTYSNDSKKYYIKAPYIHELLDALIAYIQFVASDLDEQFGIYEEDIIKILATFYDCVPLESVSEDTIEEIDLFINWESWASEYKDIINTKQFYRTGLVEFLKENIFADRKG